MVGGRSSLLVFGVTLIGLIKGLNGDKNGIFSGFKLFQARPESDHHRKVLTQLDDNVPEDAIDFWSEGIEESETVEFLVNGSLIQPVSELLTQENVPFRIKIDDFQMVVEEQMRQIRDAEGEFIFRSPGDKPDPRKSFNKFNYHNLDDINNYIIQVHAAFPDLISVESLAQTYEGRQIQMVSVSLDPYKKSNKPAIFMDCGIHAREWVSPAFCLYAIDQLVEDQALLDLYDFYIIPIANPDGYFYTWKSSGNRMWRKNRRPSAQLLLRSDLPRQFWPGAGIANYPGLTQQIPSGFGSQGFGSAGSSFGSNSNSKCWGTDPNRNFDIAHGTVGSSNNPCQDTFHGDRAFSEAESQAIRTALTQISNNHGGSENVVYVSVHAYSQLWMYPNGHIKSVSKHDKDLKRVANVAASALSQRYGTKFKAGTISRIIYQCAGSSVDWAHSKMNIKYSFALELRDTGRHGFMLPVDQIKPTVEETWSGMTAMALEIAKEYTGNPTKATKITEVF